MNLLKIILFLFTIISAWGQEEYHFYSNQTPKKIENAVLLIKSEQKLINHGDSLVSLVSLSYHDVISIDHVLVAYYLLSTKDSVLLSDTISVHSRSNLSQQISFQIKLPLLTKAGFVEIRTMDEKKTGYFNLKNPFNYTVSNTAISLDCFDPITKERIVVNQLSVKDSLQFRSISGKIFIDFYAKNDLKQSPPPMAKNYLKPAIPTPKRKIANTNKPFVFQEEGFYVISADTLGAQTTKLLVTSKKFPRYTKAEELIKPLVYITTKEEYEKLSNSKTPKASLDSFWIELAGNPDYAKKLIKIYYDRVYHANENFSQFTEGWKTDKGMIYVVFGPPDRILFEENNLEDWQYDRREETNYIFNKINHPLDDSQYSFLERNKEYDISWYPTIERWRKGLLE